MNTTGNDYKSALREALKDGNITFDEREALLALQQQLGIDAPTAREWEMEVKAEIAAAQAEEARLAEEKRIAEEQRLAEERRAAEIARIAEEKRRAEEAMAAEMQRLEEAKRRAEEERRAEEARLAEERRRAEEKRKRQKRLDRKMTIAWVILLPIAGVIFYFRGWVDALIFFLAGSMFAQGLAEGRKGDFIAIITVGIPFVVAPRIGFLIGGWVGSLYAFVGAGLLVMLGGHLLPRLKDAYAKDHKRK